jgi:hypothetical protein
MGHSSDSLILQSSDANERVGYRNNEVGSSSRDNRLCSRKKKGIRDYIHTLIDILAIRLLDVRLVDGSDQPTDRHFTIATYQLH